MSSTSSSRRLRLVEHLDETGLCYLIRDVRPHGTAKAAVESSRAGAISTPSARITNVGDVGHHPESHRHPGSPIRHRIRHLVPSVLYTQSIHSQPAPTGCACGQTYAHPPSACTDSCRTPAGHRPAWDRGDSACRPVFAGDSSWGWLPYALAQARLRSTRRRCGRSRHPQA